MVEGNGNCRKALAEYECARAETIARLAVLSPNARRLSLMLIAAYDCAMEEFQEATSIDELHACRKKWLRGKNSFHSQVMAAIWKTGLGEYLLGDSSRHG